MNLLAQAVVPTGPDVTIPTQNSLYHISDLGLLIERSLNIAIGVIGIIILGYLVWGGIDWLMAGEDKGKVEAARGKLTQGVIGLALFVSLFAIYFVLAHFLGLGNRLNISGAGSTGGTTGTTSGSCSGNVAVGATVNDGGAGGYCTNGGAAMVKCEPAGVGPSGLSYVHYEPCSCLSGTPSYSWPTCP